MFKYITLAFAIILGIVGQLFFKAGVTKAGLEMNSVMNIVKTMLTPQVIVGIAFYGTSTVFYLMTLSKMNLSVAYPALSLSYIIIMILSAIFFGESINIFKLMGTFLIVGGVSLLFIKQ